jgi:Cu(I)/Ag(I) efflux system periplasmic protein CusF
MRLVRLLAALGAAAVLQAQATTHDTKSPAPNHAQAPASATAMSDGEVRRLDKSQGKLTLRHGPLANLEMPAMTMVFRVADPKMLDALKEGDKVRFSAERVDGVITVTAIEPSK